VKNGTNKIIEKKTMGREEKTVEMFGDAKETQMIDKSHWRVFPL